MQWFVTWGWEPGWGDAGTAEVFDTSSVEADTWAGVEYWRATGSDMDRLEEQVLVEGHPGNAWDRDFVEGSYVEGEVP